MKQRFLKVLKYFFIILGVMFFIEIITVTCLAFGITMTSKANFNSISSFSPSKNNLKIMQPIISYVEDYYEKNSKYPDKIEKEIKIKKLYTYEYEVSKNNSCYTITIKPLEKQTLIAEKNPDKIKQYQRCQIKDEGSSSNSESYLEFSK